MKKYDLIIIGAGPAGLAAGLYAGRARINTLIIEKQKNGGQIVITNEIENYPGCVEGETGPSLIDRMVAQTQKFGVDHVFDTVTDVDLEGSVKKIKCIGEEYEAKAVIIASIGMLIYIIFRFKSWKYGATAIAGVVHDVLMVIAFYAIFGYTVNNPFIAAILTLVGYSINDTIALHPKDNNETNIDLSINQTLNRTIMTSLTTLVVMVPLCIMVSSAIREFIIPLMVGVIVGCYSSIFICSTLYYDLCKKDETSKYVLSTTKKAKKTK